MSQKKPVIAVIAAGALIAAVLMIIVCRDGSQANLAASGTVEAVEAQLGFPVPGRLTRVMVREGDTVAIGATLAELDMTEAEARRGQAAAQVDAARALLTELETGSRAEEVAQARAARQTAQERRNDAQRDWERTKTLYDGGATSREALDKARVLLDVAENQLTYAEEQLRLVESGPRQERIAAQRAQVTQSEAALRAAESVLQNMAIRAPFAGVVTVRHRDPGEVVPAGSPVLTLLDRNDRWVRIYIPEDQIGSVRIGQAATITTDTHPEKRYRGAVTTVASEAEFTPKTVQTARERVRLVYAVKVRILDDPEYELKPGMPADVRLDTSR
ncbi:MAG: HlyD family efflux transporter periplasmic adaptor subunit [Candidatus Zixiibacteriota bacterium]